MAMCEECFGSGLVDISIPAGQEGGEIIDEKVEQRMCLACEGTGEQKSTQCKCPKGYHDIFEECRGY